MSWTDSVRMGPKRSAEDFIVSAPLDMPEVVVRGIATLKWPCKTRDVYIVLRDGTVCGAGQEDRAAWRVLAVPRPLPGSASAIDVEHADESERAFERLLEIAKGDTGQSRRVANFVLAWWNAGVHGGFDLADLFAVDAAIAADMATVFRHVARLPGAAYPDQHRDDIVAVIARHRPEALR